MNILEEFYRGNINPSEKFFEKGSEYAGLMQTFVDNEEKLVEYFKSTPNTDKEEGYLSELIDSINGINSIGLEECFIDGWRLGAKFILDTFLVPHNCQTFKNFNK